MYIVRIYEHRVLIDTYLNGKPFCDTITKYCLDVLESVYYDFTEKSYKLLDYNEYNRIIKEDFIEPIKHNVIKRYMFDSIKERDDYIKHYNLKSIEESE